MVALHTKHIWLDVGSLYSLKAVSCQYLAGFRSGKNCQHRKCFFLLFCNCCFIYCEGPIYAIFSFSILVFSNFFSLSSFVLFKIIYDKHGSTQSHQICKKVWTFFCSYFLLWCSFYKSFIIIFGSKQSSRGVLQKWNFAKKCSALVSYFCNCGRKLWKIPLKLRRP